MKKGSLMINRRGDLMHADTDLYTWSKPNDWGTFINAFDGTLMAGDLIGTRRVKQWIGNWREVPDDGSDPWKGGLLVPRNV